MSKPKLSLDRIDRLVDGELSEAERRALLMDCEQNPEYWRDVALGYIESQILSAELRQICDEAVAPVTDSPLNDSALAGENLKSVAERSPLRADGEGSKTFRFWATAAAVLCAVGLGFGVGTATRHFGGSSTDGSGSLAGQPGSGGQNLAANDLAANGTSRVQEVPVASYGDDNSVLMLVPDGQAGYWRQVRVPLQEQDSLVENAMEGGEGIVQFLRNQGHGVEQTIKLHPFELNDGRRGVVPINNVRVNMNGYQ